MIIKSVNISYKCDNCKKERFVGHMGMDIDLDSFPPKLGNRICSACKGVMRVIDAKCVIAESDVPSNLRKETKKVKVKKDKSKSSSSYPKNPLLKQYLVTWKCKLCGNTWERAIWMQKVDAEEYFTAPDPPNASRISKCPSKTCVSTLARIIAIDKPGS